ncbi:MAG: phosphate acyltransferase PlsX [Sphingobacteriales bacterium]|nr:MAG: phosphate acyltransferase PlsX [Sphingobacteriales bacterium]
MRLCLDIMGGDFAPQAPLEGVKLALAELPQHVLLTLVGDESVIHKYIADNHLPQDRIKVVHTTQVIEMGESPTKAMTQKQDSSILVGLKLLKAGEVDIFLSAGNTGAVYVGALYTVKAIPGVMRPALISLIPKETGGQGIVLDVGANADCKPDVLYQFGVLGSIYCKAVFGIENPKVGILNIGSEPEKGNLATQAAYPIFAASDKFTFAGNVEGYDFFNDAADVIVTDGFTGNIVLKTAETIFKIMNKRGLTDEYFHRYDYENYGGTPILGVNKPVMIAHGVSSPVAFKNMMHMALQVLESGMTEKFKQAFHN